MGDTPFPEGRSHFFDQGFKLQANVLRFSSIYQHAAIRKSADVKPGQEGGSIVGILESQKWDSRDVRGISPSFKPARVRGSFVDDVDDVDTPVVSVDGPEDGVLPPAEWFGYSWRGPGSRRRRAGHADASPRVLHRCRVCSLAQSAKIRGRNPVAEPQGIHRERPAPLERPPVCVDCSRYCV